MIRSEREREPGDLVRYLFKRKKRERGREERRGEGGPAYFFSLDLGAPHCMAFVINRSKRHFTYY